MSDTRVNQNAPEGAAERTATESFSQKCKGLHDESFFDLKCKDLQKKTFFNEKCKDLQLISDANKASLNIQIETLSDEESKKEVKKTNKKKKLPKESLLKHIRKNWQLYSFFLIPIVFYIIFRYLPMAGNIIAFRRYRAGSSIFGDEWSNFKYFKQFISDQSFWRAFFNTLYLNLSYLAIRFPATLIFALLLNEIKNIHWKKFVQTVSYLPHFISMVIVAGLVRELLSANGPINNLIQNLGGTKINFIALPEWFPDIFTISGLWQGLGWGTILYLAAIAGINPSLYEAAVVDGANHWHKIWHITIPSILPTITTLLILDIGGLVGSSGAFEKVFLLYNPMTYDTSDIVSTYVYRMGVGSGNYSYATAVGLFEGIINLTLLIVANVASKKTSGSGLW